MCVKGSGVKLGDVEHVSKALQKLTGTDSLLQLAHRILFGKPGEVAQLSLYLVGTEAKGESEGFPWLPRWRRHFRNQGEAQPLQRGGFEGLGGAV